LEAEVEAEVAKIQESWDPSGLELEEVIVRPTKSDLTVNLVLVWQPWRLGPDGSAEAGFSI
jgi:hypothetical protein